MKTTKINFERWAGLLSGRIYHIHGLNGTVLSYDRPQRMFVMGDRLGNKHRLSSDHTDTDRLNAHFQGFQLNHFDGQLK